MNFQPKDLLPLLRTLSEKYTSKSSTSVSYETAQQLMGAILYCIQENSSGGEAAALMEIDGTVSAERAYDLGYAAVVDKIKQAHVLYNRMMMAFDSFGNEACEETMISGMSEFFKWYDPKFAPQNHIILLDYPVLANLQNLTGIDLIYEYLKCIEWEQIFLSVFPKKYVRAVLLQYHRDYSDLFLNITEIIVKNVLVNLMLGMNVPAIQLSDTDCVKLRELLLQTDVETLKDSLDTALTAFISKQFEGNDALLIYLKQVVPGIAAELLNAAENNCMDTILGGDLCG